ncbi:MAG: Plug domain-containing protein [Hymenobacter sp.]
MQMGVQQLDIKTIKQVPTVFGEADILRVVMTLPGVKTVGEGSTGLSVRGGGTDQNLVLYNGATIYNPAHLFGFFSAFNTDVIKSVELYKSAVPARYGGRLSSVLDIVGREGQRNKLGLSGGIGPLTSRLALEGPLAGGKGSFLVGGRVSYADWLLHRCPTRPCSAARPRSTISTRRWSTTWISAIRCWPAATSATTASGWPAILCTSTATRPPASSGSTPSAISCKARPSRRTAATASA